VNVIEEFLGLDEQFVMIRKIDSLYFEGREAS